MPGYDRSGPFGGGPMTGGARGYCNPGNAAYGPGFYGSRGYGAGMGMGFRRCFRRGMGRQRGGFSRGFDAGYPPAYFSPYAYDIEGELEMLKAHADSIGKALDAINKRVAELEKPTE